MSIGIQIGGKENEPKFINSAGAYVKWFDLLLNKKIIYLCTGKDGGLTERQWKYWIEGFITHETLHIALWKIIRTDMAKLDNIEPNLKRISISYCKSLLEGKS